MNEISSSQVVTSSFCPVQSSRETDWNFIQNARGSGVHHAVAGLSPASARRRAGDLGMSLDVLVGLSMICTTPVAS